MADEAIPWRQLAVGQIVHAALDGTILRFGKGRGENARVYLAWRGKEIAIPIDCLYRRREDGSR